jgi:3-oxoacyl-[acyl-carrier protein] reductase
MIEHDGIDRRDLLKVMVASAGLAAGAAVGQSNPESTRSNGKVALVTGSSRGIGAATAKRLARDGYAVAVTYERSRDAANEVVREIESTGGRAISLQADVSDVAAVAQMFNRTEETFGGIDVVVSNAGIMRLATLRDMTDADFNRMIDVNVKGSFYVLREAARRVRDGGRIITLSSSITLLRTPTYGPYAATKTTQEILANILAKELAGRRISVNALAPGVTNTTLFTERKTPQQIAGFVEPTPHKRLGEPNDIADVISALCSSDGWWVNGQTIFANGGIV